MKYLVTGISASDIDRAGFEWFAISLEDLQTLKNLADYFQIFSQQYKLEAAGTGISAVVCTNKVGYFFAENTEVLEDFLDNKFSDGIWIVDNPAFDDFAKTFGIPADNAKVYQDSMQSTLVPENTELSLYSESVSFEDLRNVLL